MYEIEMPGFAEQIKRLKNYDQVADDELARAMNQSVIAIASAVKPLTPVFRGVLRNSIGSEVIREGFGSIVGRVGSSLKSEEYPAVMEFGRKAGAKMPPPAALEPDGSLGRWVHLVLGVPNEKVRGVAFIVARSIARRGIKGRFFMRRGYEAAKGQVQSFFDSALNRIAERLAK